MEIGLVKIGEKRLLMRRYRRKRPSRTLGQIFSLVQLALSFLFIILLIFGGMTPTKYIGGFIVVAVLLFCFTFSFQFFKQRKINLIGMYLSLFLMLIISIGIFMYMKADHALSEVSDAACKVDNMIVVVREDDPAQELEDAADYRFGRQTSMDQENTGRMIENIEKALGQESLYLADYDTVQNEAQALLDEEIDAAIYNEAYTPIIEEFIEDYPSKVRILYRYEILTEIKQEAERIKDVEEPFNVYISGIDVSGSITANSRSDVNIIMTVNPNTKRILLTTTPRDYYVSIPGISGGQRDKLTHAGIYGVDFSMKTLEALYGINLSYYVRVNFTSMLMIVDSLGGIDVNSEYSFVTEHGGYRIEKGINHMDGATALGFSRERYSFSDGDNQRGKNQEAVIKAIVEKAASPAILTGANQILASVGDYVQTNMTRDEMAKLINMQLSDGAVWEIQSQAVTGAGDQQACFSSGSQLLYVMQPDMESVSAAAGRIKNVLEGN